MGGHGGLNILPQKKWNVYNYENREKVRRDEEAAAREEQLKREESRKRDAEFRLERLRANRGLVKPMHANDGTGEGEGDVVVENGEKEGVGSERKSNHINLFEGIKIFDPIKEDKNGKRWGREEGSEKRKKMKREESVRVVTAEDEKYRLGYGVAGKGVKLPWYLERKGGGDDDRVNGNGRGDDLTLGRRKKEEGKSSGKKTLQELREERLKREKREKAREQALLSDTRFSRSSLVSLNSR